MPRASNSELRLAAVTGLLVAIVVLGALGLIVHDWRWSGLFAGAAGLVVVVVEYRRTRLLGLLAPLGLFVALTLMEAWQLWRLRGDPDANDPLVMMGLFAAVGGLFVGGLAASILNDGLLADESDPAG